MKIIIELVEALLDIPVEGILLILLTWFYVWASFQ